MKQYDVEIFEFSADGVDTPDAREVQWSGDAQDPTDAERQALAAWDAKYDTRPRPGGRCVITIADYP
jgi:hypothetical protein